jgi:AraC family transcriptional regulator
MKYFYGGFNMEQVRIYEMPDCKMVSSGIGMFGEEKFTNFHKWFSSLTPKTMFPLNFLFEDGGKLHWVHIYESGMNVPDEFEIIDFKGGLYAVSTDIDQKTDVEAMNKVKKEFLELHGCEIDTSRPELGNIFTSPLTEKVLGYNQMDYYTPIKQKNT